MNNIKEIHPISEFVDYQQVVSDLSCNYWYEGHCPESGELLRLPRTALAEAIAKSLITQFATDDRYSREGKMYGVLLVELPNGERGVLKAFSGLLNGCSVVEGWVPSIPGKEEITGQEANTLAALEAIKQELITLQQLPARQHYEIISREFEERWQKMCDRHRIAKQQRQAKRQTISETLTKETLAVAVENLDQESRLDGIEKRKFKRERDTILLPIKQLIANADVKISQLKQQRKQLSRQLQTQMYEAYSLTNFLGRSVSLQALMSKGLMPTGTGDCCAPKLLHYAATHNLKPLAMAEFWWGLPSINGEKIPGEFYGACAERCQPLMGFLLAGLSGKGGGGWGEIKIIYEDKWLIAVNKPSGLLSVPGRYIDRQDSVWTRLRNLLPDGMALSAVHRLDLETSGILLLARSRECDRQLRQQFQQRKVTKVYEAVLSGFVTEETGVIELPLWADPQNRPYQKVDEKQGKFSVTRYQVIATEGNYTRVEFFPLTGRTHQIRVHAADRRGLGVPILGDRLYGCNEVANRLHLHARELSIQHPQSGAIVHLQVKTPF